MAKLIGVMVVVLALASLAQAEMLINRSFEAGTESWKLWGSGSGSGAGGWWWSSAFGASVKEDGTAHSGNSYIEVGFWPPDGPWWGYCYAFQEHPVTEGETYQMSAWLRDGDADGAPSLIPGGGTIVWEWRVTAPVPPGDPTTQERGDLLDINGDGEGNNDDKIHYVFDLTEEWTYFSTIEVAPPGAKGLTVIFGTPKSFVNVDIDNASWIRGSPTKAHDPQPADEAVEVPLDTVLSWKTGVLDPNDPDSVPNPAITQHNLWLSAAHDAESAPAWPDWEDPAVRISEIPADADGDGNVDPNASFQLTGLERDKLYFWVVDESLVGATGLEDWANIETGTVWAFKTVGFGPVVDAGGNILTWLKDGTTTVDLNGTVTDVDGDVTATTWSVVSSPPDSTVSIANSSVAQTTATLDKTGVYELDLHAVDATQKEDSDQVEISVFGDSCEAAQNHPDGYTAPPGDINGDCKVDVLDFALMAADWLDDTSLTEDTIYGEN